MEDSPSDLSSVEWCKESPQGTLLFLHVTPGAKRNQIAGLHGDRLKVSITQRAVDGRANKGLVEFVSEWCGVKKSAVRIVNGELSREKTVCVEGLSAAEVRERTGRL